MAGGRNRGMDAPFAAPEPAECAQGTRGAGKPPGALSFHPFSLAHLRQFDGAEKS